MRTAPRGKLPKYIVPPQTIHEDVVINDLLDDGWHPRAKIMLTPHRITQLLGLPDGWGVVFVGAIFDPNGIVVVVESDDFELVPPDCDTPYIGGALHEQRFTDDLGRVWHRETWLTDEQQAALRTAEAKKEQQHDA